MPLVEAALCKLPIITTGSTASLDIAEELGWEDFCLDFTIDWQYGPTVPRPQVNAEEMVNKLLKFRRWRKEDPEGCRRRVEMAYQMAIEQFTPEAITPKWNEIINEAKAIYDMRMGGELYFGGKLAVSE